MIKIESCIVDVKKFPDGTLLFKEDIPIDFRDYREATLEWLFENNEELIVLIYLVKHLKSHGLNSLYLKMPYIPNARQDRVKNTEDVFTLKYFVEIINYLDFDSVTVLDPHSNVSEALINNIIVNSPEKLISKVISKIGEDNLTMFYPDEGAMKRYSTLFDIPYAFGIKKRDWETGKINGLDVSGMLEFIKGRKVLIVDDISSRGGTFYYSAKKLKELGAKEVYLYVSHCENTILEGDVLTSGLIEKVYTTNSIFTENHEKIEVMNYEQ
uniref:phosphoribosyltransferase family protein n=1 Tax=Clostridium sp. 12(A) TaxID=1163671 RepID=UPI00046606A5|nr:phosphoribosyltransferase family protein [Clostridium sp. 12(A)]